MNLSFDAIQDNLRKGIFAPIYLLMGDEPYYIDAIADYVQNNLLDESERDFNQTVFYGKDSVALTIIHECMQYPVFALHRVVIVREAQELKEIAKFEEYAQHPVPSTILVICYKYKLVDKRGKFYKAIDKTGVVLETKKLYDYQMPTWICQYVTKQKLQITSQATEMLAEALGTNISAIVQGIDKLKVAEPNLREITPEVVNKYVGISKEYNNFELRDAIFARNAEKVNKIVKIFSQNERQNPIQPIIAMLFNAFEKLFAYFYLPQKTPNIAAEKLGEKPFVIQRLYQTGATNYNARKCLEIINILRCYDMRSKGFAYPQRSHGELLQEMVYRIIS